MIGDFTDAGDYRRYLRGIYAFRAPAEAALDGIRPSGALADWRAVPLAEKIEADLGDLGETSPPVETWTGEIDPSRRAGLLYVLEGSAVGAALLRARAARLGFDAERGARHLARPDEGGRWSRFVARLDAPGEEIAPEAALSAALDAFDRAARAFGGVHPA